MSGYVSEFLTIALFHLLAVASPGPDFAIVVRQSVTFGRQTALWTSVGVGLGILVHVCYSLLGIGLLISQSIALFNGLKLLGAGYLIFIGFKAVRARQGAAFSGAENGQSKPAWNRALATGFLTNVLNPKATLFFLSLFTVVIQPQTPARILAGYGLYMAVATMVWFSMVSLFFGHGAVRSFFWKAGHWFERVMGVSLILLGLKLATSSQD